jgi:hypothetical protein
MPHQSQLGNAARFAAVNILREEIARCYHQFGK